MARCYGEKTYPTPVIDVVLHMTEEEAGILLKTLIHVGGSPEGPRGKLDDIRRALRQAAVQEAKLFHEVALEPFTGARYLRIDKEK